MIIRPGSACSVGLHPAGLKILSLFSTGASPGRALESLRARKELL